MKSYASAIMYFLLLVLWLTLVIAGTSGCSHNAGSADIADQRRVNQNNDDLERYLKQGIRNQINYVSYDMENAIPVLAAAPAESDFAATTDVTNTQEAGVDEADIVEFDGERIYLAKHSMETENSGTKIEVYSSNAQTAETALLGSISLQPVSNYISTTGVYLRTNEPDKRLAVLESGGFYWWMPFFNGFIADNQYYVLPDQTVISFVDVSNPENLSVEQRWELDGTLISSRRINNKLYMAMRFSPNLEAYGINPYPVSEQDRSENERILQSLSLDDLLPAYRDRNGNSMPLVTGNNCWISEYDLDKSYYNGTLVVLSSIDLDNPGITESTCLAANVSDLYASQNAIYLFGYDYDQAQQDTGTSIYKFAFNRERDVEYRGNIVMPGYIPCSQKQYCFGEQNGVLRVLYSNNNSFTQVQHEYKLALIGEAAGGEPKLETVSTLPNAQRPEAIGKPGELVYAMRSYKDYAYIVTFDKVDPLYAINLSNPLDPYIAGALEVTGFSAYLHPVGDHYLLGVGKDAEYEEARDITWYQGIKIELFDVSDPSHPVSLANEIVGKRGSQSPVLNNSLAFSSVEVEDGVLVSVPISVNNRLPDNGDPNNPSQYYDWDHTALYLYKIGFNAVTQSPLTRLGRIVADTADSERPQFFYDIDMQRGIFHGEAIHYLYMDTILSRKLDALDN